MERMDLKGKGIDFSLGSQAELSYAELSRQKCSVDPLAHCHLNTCLYHCKVTLKKVGNPTKSDLKSITFISHRWR